VLQRAQPIAAAWRPSVVYHGPKYFLSLMQNITGTAQKSPNTCIPCNFKRQPSCSFPRPASWEVFHDLLSACWHEYPRPPPVLLMLFFFRSLSLSFLTLVCSVPYPRPHPRARVGLRARVSALYFTAL
jgi:hypothetical protein